MKEDDMENRQIEISEFKEKNESSANFCTPKAPVTPKKI